MSSQFAAFQSKQLIGKLRAWEIRLAGLGHHARLLRGSRLDARDLLAEGSRLLLEVTRLIEEFERDSAATASLTRRLRSRPPRSQGVGQYEYWGPPPAQQLSGELKGRIKSFAQTLAKTEREVFRLLRESDAELSSPTRSATPTPDIFTLIELLFHFSTWLKNWIEKNSKE